MHRDNQSTWAIRAHEYMVTPLHAIELPAPALENSDEVLGPNRRKALAHAATVTRPNSTGMAGSGSP